MEVTPPITMKTTLKTTFQESEANLSSTTITLGKYLGEEIFLEALINLNRDYSQEITTEMYLSIEFPTPFFNLEWELAPKFNDNSTDFPITNSITFSWDLSF